jgi:hypothetical protein
MGSSAHFEPNSYQNFVLKLHIDFSIFYTDSIHIILNRINSKYHKDKITIQPLISTKGQDSWVITYKYTLIPLSQRFTISAYVFSEFIFLKYLYTFSFYKVIDFTIGEFHVH